MNHLTKLSSLLVLSLAIVAHAQSTQPSKLESKAAKLVSVAKIEDPAKVAKAQALLTKYLTAMTEWHEQHDAELKTLWADWSKARSVVPKDEYPGEVIAHKIDDVYASLKPAYNDLITSLSADLTPEQIDAIKEQWSHSPGMTRTYNAYVEMAPDLTAEQKQVILGRMSMAREDAMLTDSDKEIVNIFKRHKVKVEAYIGTIEFAKLHKAFANKGKTTAPTTKPAD